MRESNKHRFLLTLIALTTLPFFLLVDRPDSFASGDSLVPLAAYISSTAGYIGISLLVWQFLLGTRSISGLFFDDLPSKLQLHKTLGIYGIAFVFLHPLLIMYTYGENVLYLFVPDRSSTFEAAVTYGRFTFIGLLIVWLSSAVLRTKLSYRPWKYLHYISYPTLLFSLLHVPDIGTTFEDKFIQFYWYSVIGITIIGVVLRLRHVFGFGKVRYEIIENRALNEAVHMLKLRYKDKNLGITTGQYAYIRYALFGEEHPFTILDHSQDSGEILIAFKKFGSFTNKLANLPAGDILLIDGPYGVFTRELTEPIAQKMRPAVFIAGGIGITPFVRHILRGDTASQMLFYGNQRREVALFRDILKQRLGRNFIDIFSHEKPSDTPQNDSVEYGILRPEILLKYISKPEQYDYYLCGPKGMMEATKTILNKSLSVPMSQIHSEDFSF